MSDGAGCGCSPFFVEEVVTASVRCQLFDDGVFNNYGVLTSAGIQRRYVRMFTGRDHIRLIEEYFLLDVEDPKDITEGILEKCVFLKINYIENPDKNKENLDKFKENTTNKNKENKNKINYSYRAGARSRASKGASESKDKSYDLDDFIAASVAHAFDDID